MCVLVYVGSVHARACAHAIRMSALASAAMTTFRNHPVAAAPAAGYWLSNIKPFVYDGT